MARFKAGDEVTQKEGTPWITLRGGPLEDMGDPQFGRVYAVVEVRETMFITWLSFSEFPNNEYDEDDFEKVVSDSVLREELESVPEPYTL